MIMTNGRFESDTAKHCGPITTVGKAWRGSTCTFKSFRYLTIWNIFLFIKKRRWTIFDIAGVTSKTRRRIALGLVASRKFRRSQDMRAETTDGGDGGQHSQSSQSRWAPALNLRRENLWCAAIILSLSVNSRPTYISPLLRLIRFRKNL